MTYNHTQHKMCLICGKKMKRYSTNSFECVRLDLRNISHHIIHDYNTRLLINDFFLYLNSNTKTIYFSNKNNLLNNFFVFKDLDVCGLPYKNQKIKFEKFKNKLNLLLKRFKRLDYL